MEAEEEEEEVAGEVEDVAGGAEIRTDLTSKGKRLSLRMTTETMVRDLFGMLRVWSSTNGYLFAVITIFYMPLLSLGPQSPKKREREDASTDAPAAKVVKVENGS